MEAPIQLSRLSDSAEERIRCVREAYDRRIASITTDDFHRTAIQIVEREVPEAKAYLADRLITSISQRRNRFLLWRQDDGTAQANDKSVMSAGGVCEEATAASAKSSESIRWKNREDFPEQPEFDMTQSHFVCPICFLLTPAAEAKGDSWIKHVIQDLKPYVCLAESCRSSITEFFDTFEEWIEHMRKDKLCVPSDVFVSCPLCFKTDLDLGRAESTSHTTSQELLAQHIANHLLSIALISLPRLYSGGVFQSENDVSPRREVDSLLGAPRLMAPPPNVNVDPPIPDFNQIGITFNLGRGVAHGPERIEHTFVAPRPPTENPVDKPYSETPRVWQQYQAPEAERFGVLVVDDNRVNQLVCAKLLEKCCHRVVVVSNGQEAFDSAIQRRCDVVLMDIAMPVMDGLEATKKIREHERSVGNQRMPIIGMPANCLSDNIDAMFKAGMDDYIPKPLSIRRLRETVAKYGPLGRMAKDMDWLRGVGKGEVFHVPKVRSRL